MSLKKQNKYNKLAPMYYGPYKVLQNIGSIHYKLDFPLSSRVHLLFHVYFLKKVIEYKIPIQTTLLELDEEGKFILESKQITKTRNKQLHSWDITEYLIKWKKLPVEDSTWEDESFIQKNPQWIKCWGQHLSDGEGNAKP